MDSFTTNLARVCKTWDADTLLKSINTARDAGPKQEDVLAVLQAEWDNRVAAEQAAEFAAEGMMA